MFELNLKRVELLNFENQVECVIYHREYDDTYYYQFVEVGTDKVDRNNPKITWSIS